MFCPNCGTENSNGTKFCKNCGTALTPMPIPKSTQSNHKRNKKRWWVYLLSIFAFLSFMFIVFGFLIGISGDDTSKSNTTNPTQYSASKTTAETTTQSKEDFITSCKTYTYKEIARNPEKYKGKPAKFTGQVIQVAEYSDEVELRVNVTAQENEFADGGYIYEDTIYVKYTRKSDSESRILEDDIITIYGTLNGIESYTSILGSQVSIPSLSAEYINIDE